MKNTSLNLLLFILLAFANVKCTNGRIMPITSASEKAKAIYADAMNSYYNFNTTEFLRLTQEAINEDPDFFMANYQLSMYYVSMGYSNSNFRKYANIAVNCKVKWSRGELILKACLRKLLKKRQHNIIITTEKPVNISQGVINNGAIEVFPEITHRVNRLIKIYPEDLNVYFHLLAFQKLFNDLEGQEMTLNSASKLTKEPAFYYCNLGNLYLSQEKYSEALRAFDKYIKYAPDKANSFDSKGNCYMIIKDFKNAYECFLKAYSLDSLLDYEKVKNAKDLWLNTVVDIDRNVYKKVLIGKQEWVNINLNVEHYRNGDIIPQVTDKTEWSNLTTGAWCYYENDPSKWKVYGKLYNWYAVNDPRGLAPSGTHIPSDKEWTTLTTFFGGLELAGGELKSRIWPYDPSNESDVAFNGLPGGYRQRDGRFYPDLYYYCWWSSTELSSGGAWCRIIYDPNQYINRTVYPKGAGMYVRCIID